MIFSYVLSTLSTPYRKKFPSLAMGVVHGASRPMDAAISDVELESFEAFILPNALLPI